MNTMNEIVITTNKISHAAGSSLGIWNWEVPVYLFLGGLTAGILIIAAVMILRNKEKTFPVAANKIILLAPVLLTLGMFALFLDLEHKLYVWRFYTAFNITSVMSWGSWILLLVYPVSLLLIAGTFRQSYPGFYSRIESFIQGSKLNRFIKLYYWIFDFSEKYKRKAAMITIPVGVFLGIYTGVLLSAFGARPFWNSGIFGPLFLVSGMSTAAALILLLAKEKEEKLFFMKLDLSLIAVEAFLLILFIVGLVTSTSQHINAAGLILGGALTPVFWIFIFGIGLGLPAFLEALELKGKHIPAALAPVLVLAGGLLLRIILVEGGQMISWLPY
ncbi:MAG: polysulfide reductase NrfD [bacterium]|nr:polysulfide reductase NrfD [bacterium]